MKLLKARQKADHPLHDLVEGLMSTGREVLKECGRAQEKRMMQQVKKTKTSCRDAILATGAFFGVFGSRLGCCPYDLRHWPERPTLRTKARRSVLLRLPVATTSELGNTQTRHTKGQPYWHLLGGGWTGGLEKKHALKVEIYKPDGLNTWCSQLRPRLHVDAVTAFSPDSTEAGFKWPNLNAPNRIKAPRSNHLGR
ncbi:hypothetical protein Bbelb_192070 [Branchiostoma belcheri]|nr:hypothetical protein Bbelb_192070 [Branchiostoma belcheri]